MNTDSIENLPGEEWRDIEGYLGLYQVSNKGRVKSLNYNRTGKEQILKNILEPTGYYRVNLAKEGKWKHFTVHRLVCNAFIPNPNNLPCINHKDENKQNNSLQNLEWCTVKYNINYGTARLRQAQKNKKNVKVINLLTKEKKIFKGLKDTEKFFNLPRGTIITYINRYNGIYKKQMKFEFL